MLSDNLACVVGFAGRCVGVGCVEFCFCFGLDGGLWVCVFGLMYLFTCVLSLLLLVMLVWVLFDGLPTVGVWCDLSGVSV